MREHTPDLIQLQLPFDEIPVGLCQCGCGQPTKIAPVTARRLGWIKGQPIRFANGHNPRKPRPILDTIKLCECGCGEPAPISPITDPKRGYITGMPMRYIVGHQVNVRPLRSVEDRFWAKVDKRGPEQCWEWHAAKDPKGYGQIQRGGRRKGHIQAHRLSFELHNGPIPKDMEVCHSCDNPACCNPAHLWLGTHKANMADCSDKGRNYRTGEKRPKGEHTGSAILMEAQVREIRSLCERGIPRAEIAKRYGMAKSTITAIYLRVNWKHVE